MDSHLRQVLRERLGKCLDQDVERAVDIRVDQPSARRSKQSTLDAFAPIMRLMPDRFAVQKATLGGIALFDEHHLDTHQCRFVTQHVDEASMGDEDERLVVLHPHLDLLLAA